MERLTEICWRNLDPWECCGQDHYCQRGCHDEGGCTNGCIVPKLYDRLAAYEDTGLEPEEIVDLQRAWDMYGGEEGITAMLASPPNAPLTLSELREMDGEPVWVEQERGGQYRIIDSCIGYFTDFSDGGYLRNTGYGDTWTAYRRKPDEGTL